MAAPNALLTDTIAAEITNAVTNGCSIDDAAGAVGVHPSSVFRWQKRGREASANREAGAEPLLEDSPYIAFADGLEQARAKSKVEAIHMWRKAILGWDHTEVTVTEVTDKEGNTVTKTVTKTGHRFDYRAVVEWMERRYPMEFGRIIRQEISGPGGEPIPIEERALSLAAEVERFLQTQQLVGPPEGE